MLYRSLIGAGALVLTLSGAQAFDQSKYPDLKGQWVRAQVPEIGRAHV